MNCCDATIHSTVLIVRIASQSGACYEDDKLAVEEVLILLCVGGHRVCLLSVNAGDHTGSKWDLLHTQKPTVYQYVSPIFTITGGHS